MRKSEEIHEEKFAIFEEFFQVFWKLNEESVEEEWGELWKNWDRLSISEEEKFWGTIIKGLTKNEKIEDLKFEEEYGKDNAR